MFLLKKAFDVNACKSFGIMIQQCDWHRTNKIDPLAIETNAIKLNRKISFSPKNSICFATSEIEGRLLQPTQTTLNSMTRQINAREKILLSVWLSSTRHRLKSIDQEANIRYFYSNKNNSLPFPIVVLFLACIRLTFESWKYFERGRIRFFAALLGYFLLHRAHVTHNNSCWRWTAKKKKTRRSNDGRAKNNIRRKWNRKNKCEIEKERKKTSESWSPFLNRFSFEVSIGFIVGHSDQFKKANVLWSIEKKAETKYY